MTGPPRREGGFAVIAVLVLVALMATVAVTMARHAAMEPVHSAAGRQALESREAAESALAFAQGLVDRGQHVSGQTVSMGDASASISTTALPDGGLRADVTSMDSNGVGTTFVVEGGRLASAGDEPVDHPSDLPTVRTEVATGLLSDPDVPKLSVAGQLTLTDQTVEGLIILESNAELTLSDVVVEGAIVSRASLDGSVLGDFNPWAAPELVLDGPVRVRPGAFLPDVSVVLADGVVRSTSTPAGYQFDGAVVAHTLDLGPTGALHGGLAYVDLTLPDTVVRPGSSRPQELPADLDPGAAWETSFLAVLPKEQQADELGDITGYWKAQAEDAKSEEQK